MNAVSAMNYASAAGPHVRLWPKGSPRRVTWLELFFDIIFVAAVAQIGIPLSQDYSLLGLARYVFMFVLIWWAWLGHTTYCTRFQAEDWIQRLLTFLQFFAVAIMAANAKEGLATQDSAGFGAAYSIMRTILVVQYLRARHISSTRKLTSWYAGGFGIAAVLWLMAAVVPVPFRFGLWGFALLVDFATPWAAASHARNVPADASHFPERFGLFTLILLGESVAAIMHGIESQPDWSPSAVIAAFSSLSVICGFWWAYFELARGADERNVRSPHDRSMLRLWQNSHLFFYIAVATLGVGFEHVIMQGTLGSLGLTEVLIVATALFVATTSLLLIGYSGRAKAPRM